ncbi:MAG: efflux RND transporter periplasmic adaptor subunit [Rhodospirillales bacterium]
MTLPLIGLTMLIAACDGEDKAAAPPPPPAPEVTVAAPLLKEIVEWDEYTGRFEAVERVEIRARVSGYMDKVLFKEGQQVSAGQSLFVIDQRPFRIALDRTTAQYELARKENERAESLQRTSAASVARLDQTVEALRAAKADLDRAKLDMLFTEIKAPISGRISRNYVDVGNLVNGDTQAATLLTTIVSENPIHFYFEISEQQLLKYSRLDKNGSRQTSRDTANPIYIRLQDEKDFGHVGRMDFVDNEIDPGTGTMQGRAILDNPDGILTPGLFGRARLPGSGIYQAILVPDAAIGTDQSRKFVTIVNAEGKAEMRFVEPGPIRASGLRIIRKGLGADDKIVINGLQRARPGTPVTVKEGVIEEPDTEPLPKLPGQG